MSLSTLQMLKDQCGLSDVDAVRDKQIEALIAGSSDLIKRQFGRRIEKTTFTEYYSGKNRNRLRLRQFPVVSVTSVCFDQLGAAGQADGAFDASGLLEEGVDYMLEPGQDGNGSSGILLRLNGVWEGTNQRYPGYLAARQPKNRGNIKVVYVAGFFPVPMSITMAVNDAVMKKLLATPAGGAVQSASYEDASVSYPNMSDMVKVFGAVENVLAAYQTVPI